MVAATSMTAACLSSIILGSFMCALVVICRKFGRDPGSPHSFHLQRQTHQLYRQHCAPNSVMPGGPHNPMSPGRRCCDLHTMHQRAYHPHHNHTSTLRRRNWLDPCNIEKSACKTVAHARMVSTIRCHDHQQRDGPCLGSLRQPLSGFRFAGGGHQQLVFVLFSCLCVLP